MGLFDKLFCKHQWKSVRSTQIWDDGYRYPIGFVEIWVCNHCGKIRKIKY